MWGRARLVEVSFHRQCTAVADVVNRVWFLDAVRGGTLVWA